MRPNGLRPVLALGALIGAVVIAAIAIVLLIGAQRPASYASGSPEWVLQQYVAALDAGDLDRAWSLLSVRGQSELPLAAFRDQQMSWPDRRASRRVWIDRTDASPVGTTIHMVMETYYSSGLQSSRYRQDANVLMVQENGAWRIDQRPYWL